jgi:purine-binding chemotaxis protein CheW
MNALSRNPAGIPAMHTQSGPSTEIPKQFITFTLDAQEYGVDIMRVREIKGWTETTALPQSPTYVRGVINLRGIIVPILDLRARFGMGATETTRMHVVIIVITDTRTTGLLVDAVSDIISVEPNTIRPVPQMDLPTEESFLEGLVAMEDRMVTLVSLDGLIGPIDARGSGYRPH